MPDGPFRPEDRARGTYETRIVELGSLALLVLGALTTVLFPFVAGFNGASVATNASVTVGLLATYLLVRRGQRRAAQALFLSIMVAALVVVTLRDDGSPLHNVFVMAMALPIGLAFALGVNRLAVLLCAGSVAYVLWRAATQAQPLVEAMSVVVILIGTTLVAGIAPAVRRQEQRRADAAERQARELAASLSEAQQVAQLGSWQYDYATRQATWSPETFRIFGKDPASFAPQFDSIAAAIHPDDRARVLAGFESFSASGQPWREVYRVVHPGGQVVHVEQIARLRNGPDGSPLRAVGTVQDVTMRIEAEAAQRQLAEEHAEVDRLRQLTKMRSEFLNMAAHDLKTPLTPLRVAMATMKLQQDPTPDQRRQIELVERNVQRFSLLIEDLLDAARMQAGRLNLRLEDVDLAASVREAVDSFREAAAANGVPLELDAPHQAVVRADALRVSQVLMNLVSNAVQYAPRGRITVRLLPEPPGDAPKAWRIEVQDTGIGLTAEQRAKLFQPFVRAHEARGVPKGTGLGLYITKGILEEHGGTVGVTSAGPDKGSTFHVTFPVQGPMG